MDGGPGAKSVEQTARPRPLADFEGRPIVALVHQEIDQKRVGAPLRRQEVCSQIRADETGTQLLHPGHGLFSVGARRVAEPQGPLRSGEGVERLGLTSAVAQSPKPRQSFLEDEDGLPGPGRQDQRTPEGLRLRRRA
jgi:hypothetical protein